MLVFCIYPPFFHFLFLMVQLWILSMKSALVVWCWIQLLSAFPLQIIKDPKTMTVKMWKNMYAFFFLLCTCTCCCSAFFLPGGLVSFTPASLHLLTYIKKGAARALICKLQCCREQLIHWLLHDAMCTGPLRLGLWFLHLWMRAHSVTRRLLCVLWITRVH